MDIEITLLEQNTFLIIYWFTLACCNSKIGILFDCYRLSAGQINVHIHFTSEGKCPCFSFFFRRFFVRARFGSFSVFLPAGFFLSVLVYLVLGPFCLFYLINSKFAVALTCSGTLSPSCSPVCACTASRRDPWICDWSEVALQKN